MFTNSMNLTVPGAGPGGGAGGLPPSASLLDGGGGGGGSVSQLSGYVGGRATPNGDAVSAGEGGRGGAGREKNQISETSHTATARVVKSEGGSILPSLFIVAAVQGKSSSFSPPGDNDFYAYTHTKVFSLPSLCILQAVLPYPKLCVVVLLVKLACFSAPLFA